MIALDALLPEHVFVAVRDKNCNSVVTEQRRSNEESERIFELENRLSIVEQIR